MASFSIQLLLGTIYWLLLSITRNALTHHFLMNLLFSLASCHVAAELPKNEFGG